MVPVKVAISGHPGSGKTSTLLRIAQMLSEEYSIGGFTTHPIKEEGYIVGYGLKNYTTELCDECTPKTQNDKTPTSHCEACGAYEQGIVASKNWDVKPRITVLHDEEPVNLGIQLSVVNKIALFFIGISAIPSIMLLHKSTHSSQIKTEGPAINFRTSFWPFPQKEQYKILLSLLLSLFFSLISLAFLTSLVQFDF